MVEKDFQRIFTGWVRDNPPKRTTVWEIKLNKGPSIAFARVYDHQIQGLREAKGAGHFHKISDSPMSWMKGTPMRFGKPKPFDCMYVRDAEAYVVILFYKLRAPKEMVFIDVDAWVKEKEGATRKSLTEARAKEISHHIIKL